MNQQALSPAGQLRRVLDQILSKDVRPFLRDRGFTKHGRIFRRVRGPLYDKINVQGSVKNYDPHEHLFFVNVGVGSTEMDALHIRWPRPEGMAVREYVLDKRWEKIDPGLPAELTFDHTTDPEVVSGQIAAGLSGVVEFMDSIHTTSDLARWSIANNGLVDMPKVASYLAAIGDEETLAQYAHSLRHRFGDEDRWEIFNQKLIDACGPIAPRLFERGALDAG